MCAIDWYLIGMKQVLYSIHQHSEKRIAIHCKVTFGFQFINTDSPFPIVKDLDVHSSDRILGMMLSNALTEVVGNGWQKLHVSHRQCGCVDLDF